VTSGAVVLLTCASYFAYEYLTFRQTILGQLSTLGEIIARTALPPWLLGNERDAGEILAALKAERHIVTPASTTAMANCYRGIRPTLPPTPFLLRRNAMDTASTGHTSPVFSRSRRATGGWARSISSPTWGDVRAVSTL